MPMMRRIAIGLVAVQVSAGCVTRPVMPPTLNETRNSSASGVVLTNQDLSRVAPRGSLLDALKRLQPSMLISRGSGPPRVSVDGSPPTDLSILEMIQASEVREVRFQRASSSVGRAAITKNGDVIVGDLIVVTTWPGDRGSGR